MASVSFPGETLVSMAIVVVVVIAVVGRLAFKMGLLWWSPSKESIIAVADEVDVEAECGCGGDSGCDGSGG